MDKRFVSLVVRYVLLLVVGFNLPFFYGLLLRFTVVVSSFVFSLFSSPLVVDNFIRLPFVVLEIIPSCVAGSAFYLLLVLSFSLGSTSWSKRLLVFFFSASLLFLFNVFRIVILAFLGSSNFFPVLHWLFFTFLSTVVVVLLWLFALRLFSVSAIPFWTDVGLLLEKADYSKAKKRYYKSAKKHSHHDGRYASSSVKSKKPCKKGSRPRSRSR
jgi:exosortase/archaeosortase family protein